MSDAERILGELAVDLEKVSAKYAANHSGDYSQGIADGLKLAADSARSRAAMTVALMANWGDVAPQYVAIDPDDRR